MKRKRTSPGQRELPVMVAVSGKRDAPNEGEGATTLDSVPAGSALVGGVATPDDLAVYRLISANYFRDS